MIEELKRRALIGLGRVGARAVGRAYASVVGDIATLAREIESRATEVQTYVEEKIGDAAKQSSNHRSYREPRR